METTEITALVSECDMCGAEIEFYDDVEVHELIECIDCGTEYEVTSISPIQIREAPIEAEDWGE